MSLTLASGVVEVTADAKGLPGQIAKDLEDGDSTTRAAGASVGRSVFGGVIAGFAAIGGAKLVTDFFVGGITGASDLNETLSKSKQIFGDNASAIESFGNSAAKNLGLSKDAAISAAAGFGDMFTQLGFSGDQAAAFSQTTVQMAADLGSFSNLDTADVAERISAAFRGEYDSLQTVIPNISAARVEHEALALGLVASTVSAEDMARANTKADLAQRKYNEALKEHGPDSTEALTAGLALDAANQAVEKAAAGATGEITAQAKAQAVMSIIQKDGARAMGDFARTSDGAANSTKIATASLEDQQAKLGGLLLPAWQGFLGFLNDSAIPAFSDLIDWIGKNGDTLLLLAGVIGGAALAYGVITTAMGIYAAFQVAQAAATGGLTIAQWALNAALTANPIGLVIVLIAALVGAIIWVATQTTFFADAWTWLVDIVSTAWTWLWETVLSPVFTAIGEAFNWIYNVIIVPIVTGIMIYVGLWAALFTWLWQTVLAPFFAGVGELFTWLWEFAVMPVVNGIGMAITGLGVIFQWLYSTIIAPVFAGIGAVFNWLWVNVISPNVNFITGAIRTIGDTAQAVFSGFASVIGGAFQAALSVVRGPINGIISLVNSAIRGINGLHVTIPAWVPIVGGQTWGLNLPTIPMLARGSASSPDTFIAGENGPELIVGRPGSRVYPADQTRNMLDGGRDAPLIGGDLIVNEAEDPLGSAERVSAELRKWRKR